MKFAIILTWSKIVAVLVLASAVYLDIQNGGSNTLMFSMPFIVFLITGKQFIDRKKDSSRKQSD